MLAKYLVLALLPTIAYGRISINVKPQQNGATVDFRGEDVEIITDNDRDIFKINDETLKKASEIINGKRCSDVYVKPPTPWGDVYQQNGWDTVKSKLRPFHSSVTGFSSKPVVIGEQEYVNTNDIDVKYNMSVIKDVVETISHTWTKGNRLGAGREINYNINFGDKSVGGSKLLSYSAPWGDDTTKSRTVTVGNTTSTSASIPPGGKILTTLMATHHRVEVEIRYEALIDGKVFCNYEGGYNGQKFYALPIKQLQHAAHTPLTVYAIETISLSFYSNARLEMTNGSQ